MIKVQNDEKLKNSQNTSKIALKSRFQPELNHLYSGRNNDNNGSYQELYYFIVDILPKLFFTRKVGDGEECT